MSRRTRKVTISSFDDLKKLYSRGYLLEALILIEPGTKDIAFLTSDEPTTLATPLSYITNKLEDLDDEDSD